MKEEGATVKRKDTREEWEIAGTIGNSAVRTVLAGVCQGILDEGKSGILFVPTCFGALAAIGDLLKGCVKPERRTSLEEMAMCYLRGSMRGLDHPVYADGTPVPVKHDA